MSKNIQTYEVTEEEEEKRVEKSLPKPEKATQSIIIIVVDKSIHATRRVLPSAGKIGNFTTSANVLGRVHSISLQCTALHKYAHILPLSYMCVWSMHTLAPRDKNENKAYIV